MNELLIQGGAFGAVVVIALSLVRLVEKIWDKRNGGTGDNGLKTVLIKLSSNLDVNIQVQQELIQDIREIRDDQERIKSFLIGLERDSEYLRSWHEKTEDGRIAAYFPHEQTGQQHREVMVVLREIASGVKSL